MAIAFLEKHAELCEQAALEAALVLHNTVKRTAFLATYVSSKRFQPLLGIAFG